MKKILAIDDQQDNLTTLKAVIQSHLLDCETFTALSGKEGLKIAQKEQPDVILLDIIMPQMDGYEVCEKLKTDELTKHIPIVMITAIKTDIESRVKGLNLGADAFLSKPIDPIELTSQIKVMLRIKEAEDQLRRDKNMLEELVSERTKKLSESEELFRLIAENTSDNIGITTFDLKAKYLYVSPSIRSVLGYDEKDLVGKSFFDFIHPDDKKLIFPLLVEYVSTKTKNLITGKSLPTSRTIEFRFKNKAGEWRFIQSALNIMGKNILAVSRDITEQKAIESKLKSNERILRDIIDTSPNLIFVKDRDGKYLVVNKKMADYHRTTPEKLVGTYDYQLAKDYFKTNAYDELRKTERNVIETKKPYYLIEDHFINDFGDERWFQTVMLPFDSADNQNCIMIIATDVTEFVKIKQTLQESEIRFKELVELLPEAIIETDQNLRITYANKRAHELSGLSEKDFEKGVNGIDLLIPEDRERAKEYFIGRAKGLNPPKTIQYQALKKDGTKFHIHLYSDSIIKAGSFNGIRAIIADVSRQKKIEQTLIESEERYRSLLENLPVGVFRSTYEGKVISANPAMAAIYGYDSVEELLNVEAKDYYDESNPRELMLSELKEKGFLIGKETLENKKDGSLIWVSANYKATFNAKGEWLFIDGVLIDITERKKTENHLKKSEQDYRGLFENSHDAIIIFEPEGEMVLDVNERACKLYGFSRHEFIGMSIKDISHDISEGEKNLQLTLKEGFFNQFQTIQYKKDGSPLYLEINASMVEFGGQHAILSNNRDITERKHAEQEFHESTEKYRNLYNSTNDAIFIMKDYIYTSCNPRTLEMFECSEADILGHPPADFSPKYQPDGKSSVLKAQEKIDAAIAGMPQSFEWVHKKKNGIEFIVEVSLNKMMLKNGEYINAILRDITDRKRSEQTQKVILEISKFSHENLDVKSFLGKVHSQVNSILNARNFYVALYNKSDDTYTFPYFIDETENLESNEPEKLKGSLTDFVRRTGKGQLISEEVEKKIEATENIQLIGNPSPVWLGAPLLSASLKEVIGVIAIQDYHNKDAYSQKDLEVLEIIAYNIGAFIERIQTLEDLKRAKEKAEESDRLKSSFLATMSHELRTPLNAIIGFSDVIGKDIPIDDIIQFNQTINKSGNHLLTIVEDLFDITLIETGEIKIFKDTISIGSLLNEVKAVIKIEQQKLKKNQVELNLIIPTEGKDLMIKTDPARLKQILINLLKNAIKFTDKGSVNFGFTINLASELVERPVLSIVEVSRNAELKFFVKDTGIGIPKNKQELIFDIFRQVDDSHTRKYGGTGIGLSISKKLSQLLGGDIWVESEEGQGSSFFFTIPMEQSIAVNTSVTNINNLKEDLKDKIILVVEDDESSFEFLKAILRKPGYNIIWATNGEEAVKICKENTTVDVVLMDINMPVMNGYDATKAIKKLRPLLPIIAQTAYAIAGDREKSIAAGCDDYISKPIKKELLLDKIGKLLSNL